MSAPRPRRRPTVAPFQWLARTHAFMALGDASMYGALAGSVFLSLSPDAQRSKVLLYLLVSAAPFAVVAPAIGPTVDRIPGGRRMVVQITAIGRAVTYFLLMYHVRDLLLYPLVFAALVLQKTYAVSKSALVPSVVHDEQELVEANSKLSLISGVVGAIGIGPLALMGKLTSTLPLLVGILLFLAGTMSARRLPRDVVASKPAPRPEKLELRSAGIRLAAGAMVLIRASVGFLTFHLLFWLHQRYGLAAFGLAAGGGALGSVCGNVVAPHLRQALRERRMLVGALGVIAVAGFLAAFTSGLFTAVVLAFVVNFSGAVGRLAFDSIVQRDAPDANQGRAFAQFEARFQLAWVLAGLPPVAFTMPGWMGFFTVGAIGLFAMVSYLIGSRAVRAGRPVPPTLSARARRSLMAEVRKRRTAQEPAKGKRMPPPSGRPSPAPRRPRP